MRAGSVAGLCDIGVQCELPFQIYGSGLFLLLPFVERRVTRSFKNDAAGMLQHVSSGGLHTEDSTLSRPRSVSTGEVLRLSEK